MAYEDIVQSTAGKMTGKGGGMGAGLFALGSILDLGSSIYGASLQNKLYKANAGLAEAQGNYSSSVAEFNAAVARSQAEAIRVIADIDIGRQKTAAVRFKSGQMAKYASAGVKLTGSPIDVMIDSAMNANLDMAITDYEAKVGMLRATTQAKGYEQEGVLAKSIAGARSDISKALGKNVLRQSVASGISSGSKTLLTLSDRFMK